MGAARAEGLREVPYLSGGVAGNREHGGVPALTSCDTNILLYYLNKRCPEHCAAKAYLESVFASEEFAICELVLVELYVLLRTPAVLKRPLDAAAAVDVVQRFRSNPAWAVIESPPGGVMNAVWREASDPEFPRRAIFDARLAHTLKRHGVTEFVTRNVDHFRRFGFARLINPIDDPGQ